MQDKFKDPADKEEFEKRANGINPKGAKSVILALGQKRAKAIGTIDTEIQFLRDAIQYRKDGTIPARFQ